MSKKLTRQQIQDKSISAFEFQRFNFIEIIDKRTGKFHCNEHNIEFLQDIFSHFNGTLSCKKCIEIRDRVKRLNRLQEKTNDKYETISLVRISKINSNKGFFFCSIKNHGNSNKSYYFNNTILGKKNSQVPCAKCQKENRKAPKNKKSDEELKKLIEKKHSNLIYIRRNKLNTKRCFVECKTHTFIEKSILIDSLLNKENKHQFCDKCKEKKIPYNKYSNEMIQGMIDQNLNMSSTFKISFLKRDVSSYKESYGFFTCEEHGSINTPKLIQNSIRENAVNPCDLCVRDMKSWSNEEIQIESDKKFGNFIFLGRTKENFLIGYFVCKNHPERGVHQQEVSSHNRGHNPCCSVKSKNEIEIIKILNKLKIQFIFQYSYRDCRNIKPLLFDFYLPKYDLLIEYDGKQHFEFIKRFGDYNKFIRLQKCDGIKNRYAEEREINLLRIPYKLKNKKEKLIRDAIKDINLGKLVYEVDLMQKNNKNEH